MRHIGLFLLLVCTRGNSTHAQTANWTQPEKDAYFKACMAKTHNGQYPEVLAKPYCQCFLDKAVSQFETKAQADKLMELDMETYALLHEECRDAAMLQLQKTAEQ